MKKKAHKAPVEHSIHELARRLNVSTATISRVLNNHPHVHKETRRKVMAMVEKVGYRRNAMASGLRSNKTNTVGLIVPRISMFFHAEVITTIQNELHAHGYRLIICQSNDSLDLEKELTRTLYASRVAAVIVSCTLFTTDFSHFDVLTENNIPVIFYDRVPVKPYPACIIKGDDFQGGYLATKHLLEEGCRRIAYISGPMSCGVYADRLAGCHRAMQAYGLSLSDKRVFYQELTAENARKAMNQLFSKKPYPDAIFAANDVSALEALHFAHERGIAVPEELKIVGYSNDPRSAIVSPSMTTIEQFPTNTGRVVVTELLKILKGNQGHDTEDVAEHPTIVTAVELIKRKSS
ncbi:MAG TPA: LacI family DNA-binding transcriptional regulator [Puia sp.]|jgi:LacI family transcriptional regulator|nr:LacI family DNA-binding transcriptional regulator [Puia sp.]